jgi:hypothetical protein
LTFGFPKFLEFLYLCSKEYFFGCFLAFKSLEKNPAPCVNNQLIQVCWMNSIMNIWATLIPAPHSVKDGQMTNELSLLCAKEKCQAV